MLQFLRPSLFPFRTLTLIRLYEFTDTFLLFLRQRPRVNKEINSPRFSNESHDTSLLKLILFSIDLVSLSILKSSKSRRRVGMFSLNSNEPQAREALRKRVANLLSKPNFLHHFASCRRVHLLHDFHSAHSEFVAPGRCRCLHKQNSVLHSFGLRHFCNLLAHNVRPRRNDGKLFHLLRDAELMHKLIEGNRKWFGLPFRLLRTSLLPRVLLLCHCTLDVRNSRFMPGSRPPPQPKTFYSRRSTARRCETHLPRLL